MAAWCAVSASHQNSKISSDLDDHNDDFLDVFNCDGNIVDPTELMKIEALGFKWVLREHSLDGRIRIFEDLISDRLIESSFSRSFLASEHLTVLDFLGE